MSKKFSFLAVVFCALWSASQALALPSICASVAGNLVGNCGFETGDLTAWTASGNTLNPSGIYYGVDTFDTNTGAYGAFVSQDFIGGGTAPVDLSQTLATTASTQYTITFFLEQDTAPVTGYAHTFSATWGGTTMLSLTPTVAVPGTVGAFTEYQFTESATGGSTLLNFAFENDNSYWSFDDVSVQAQTPAQTPEPSTGVLAGTALCALLLIRGAIVCR